MICLARLGLLVVGFEFIVEFNFGDSGSSSSSSSSVPSTSISDIVSDVLHHFSVFLVGQVGTLDLQAKFVL